MAPRPANPECSAGARSSLPGVMPMDPGFCEDLTGRLYSLLIVLEDRPYLMTPGDSPVRRRQP